MSESELLPVEQDAASALRPCETLGLEDMEPGCCEPCRARHRLTATTPAEKLAEALVQAIADLRTVGDDYPGSSCHKWCHERANAAWAAFEAWRFCPSTHCERRQECCSPNECSAQRIALAVYKEQTNG